MPHFSFSILLEFVPFGTSKIFHSYFFELYKMGHTPPFRNLRGLKITIYSAPDY